MVSIEQRIKAQFGKVFKATDWSLFKKMAESNLSEATKLQKRDMLIDIRHQLLARNSRKRLLIGIGVELMLKAVYLKRGYMINRPPKESPLKFPFSEQAAAGVLLAVDRTFMLDDLITNLPKVVQLQNKGQTINGLKIAKVFRNKEGHGVTSTHAFDASNYTDIATSLSALYQDAFGEKLSVQFSLAPREVAIWQISGKVWR